MQHRKYIFPNFGALSLLFCVGICSQACKREDREDKGQRNPTSLIENKDSLPIGRKSRLEHDQNTLPRRDEIPKSAEELLRAIADINLIDGISEQQSETIRKLVEFYPKVALSTLYTKDNVHLRLEFTKLCEALSEEDAEQITLWLKEVLPKLTQDKRTQSQYWADLITVLAKNNPERAIETLLSSPLDQKDMVSSVVRLIVVTSHRDPEQAIELLNQLPDSYREAAYYGLSYSFAKTDPTRSLEMAAKIQNADERSRISSYVFDQWLKADPQAACNRLISLGSEFEKIGLSDLAGSGEMIKNLSNSNPNVLRELLFKLVPSTQNQALFEKAITELSMSNMDIAFITINDLPKGALKDKLMLNSFSIGDPPKDLSTVIEMIENLEGRTRELAIMGMAQRFSSASISDILTASEDLQGTEKSVFIGSALVNLRSSSSDDLVGALGDSKLNNLLTKEHLATVTQDVAERLAHSDYAGAVVWFDKLPEDRKQAAMRGISEELAKREPNELAKWLGSRVQDENWKTGVTVLVQQLKYTDIEMAEKWEEQLKKWESSSQK